MDFDFYNAEELLLKAKAEDLYVKLLAQLQKDFDLSNVAIEIPNTTAPKELQSLIQEKIYYLLLEKFDEYLHLLYVIDLPESAFKNIHMTDVVEVSERMTFFVLRRELQKVWFKKQYSS